MTDFSTIAPAFVDMAHSIVWASVATVDQQGRPRSRVLHPIWQWDGTDLVGWVATAPTPTKRSHLSEHPFVSVNYWASNHDTCVAECATTWAFDLVTRSRVWDLFVNTPEPVGYNPAMIAGWDDASSDMFAVLRLDPWRIRVMPGSVLMGQGGDVLTWSV